jgi:AraC family transcriptional activator of pobA
MIGLSGQSAMPKRRIHPSPAAPPDAGGAGFPSVDLYGEPQARARLDPVHVEALVARSALHNWRIRPHRHRDLFQLFWIRRGGGVLLGQGAEYPFSAPVLLIIPAGQVHGFRYDPASAGHVLTLTDAFLAACGRLAGDAFAPGTVATLPLGREERLAEELDATFARLLQAFRGLGADRNAALAGHVLLLLSLLLQGTQDKAGLRPGAAQGQLVRRFREDIEQHYRAHAELEAHCRRLGVTQSTLTRACRAMTGLSPLELIHERLMAEARRLLIHGSRNVSGVAYELGFDPAYFSRFFTRREGISPAAFQRRHTG